MARWFLDSLEINGYRLFKQLGIPRLGRVNLITGKNNAGKTAVLEAVRLWARRGMPTAIREVLSGRGEWPASVPAGEPGVVLDLDEALRNLFHGRPDLQLNPVLSIGPVHHPDQTLEIGAVWLTSEYTGDGDRLSLRPSLSVAMGHLEVELWLDEFEQYLRLGDALPAMQQFSPLRCVQVSPGGLDEKRLALAWDEIALTEIEDRVLEALRLIAPEIERIHSSSSAAGRSLFRVRTRTAREPFLLSSMGDGINRLLGITIATAQAKNGILLLDEVENGLHYTVQADLWRHVFRMSRDLNVQVFATTHSYDCVRAFQRAATESPEEGCLVRLDRSNDQAGATVFDEEDLEIVTEEAIEVR